MKRKTLNQKRYLSLEQALITTRVHRENPDDPVILRRARSLAASLSEISINIDPDELIVGNRTEGIRSGVVSPEAGITWLAREIETLSERPQDPFHVNQEDIELFRNEIEPWWKGKSLEDYIYGSYGDELKAIEKIVKINQKDHAQGHICPGVEKWLRLGPVGLIREAQKSLDNSTDEQELFYRSVYIVLEAAQKFMQRYSQRAADMASSEGNSDAAENLMKISDICAALAERPPMSYREALQSVWFLFVILHMESNASSFSPGRMDQYLYPYLLRDLETGNINIPEAQELMDALFVKFNQIVYMRNAHSAKYFAGFPIGFNVTIGGQLKDGRDAVNQLSYMILKSQEHVGLPQPNLTARLHRNSPDEFLKACVRVIGLGAGMPQIVNDESIIPSLLESGMYHEDAIDYVLVGCVELSSQGNYLGWSDAAMFNLVKALELALNDGKCLITGKQLGPKLGCLEDYESFEDLEMAFSSQIDHFVEKMLDACAVVEKAHQSHLPSPFLSSVVENCLKSGKDITMGGAKYNYSGVQAIQVANVADSLAVLKNLVFGSGKFSRREMLEALRQNFAGFEELRYYCINMVPKYGNDVQETDMIGSKWVEYFSEKLKHRTNFRGGRYQMGLYTVSAHLPMGENVGASCDGRKSGAPLADGGMSPMYGMDKHGPTSVLNSVSRIPSILAANGTLLNMKFLPSFFTTEEARSKFSAFLRSFVRLPIHHIQFNVISKEDLLKAKLNPDMFKGLTVRVAGYTAYFTELSPEMQDEIIQRTEYGDTT